MGLCSPFLGENSFSPRELLVCEAARLEGRVELVLNPGMKCSFSSKTIRKQGLKYVYIYISIYTYMHVCPYIYNMIYI